ncbi:non-ribosomal peptide synthetase, partial [Xenorhabdus sp. PR6a]|uniref:non-ribosomal peptide synthetase n=1 Tax=Xenorhabdus sp. PR6a TaxID=3025877 RepID=UPI002358C89F
NHYVYVDLNQPKVWITEQLNRIGCRIIINSLDENTEHLPNGIAILTFEPNYHTNSFRLKKISAIQPAYINFSSGSSGIPKAIVCTHAGVTRLCRKQNFLNFEKRLNFLLHSPLSFDASTLEIWGALLNGGCCIINHEKLLTPSILQQEIRHHNVNTLWLTVSLFNALVDADIYCLNGLHTVLTGGDILSVPHLRKAFCAHPEINFINGYGPTENTTFTCCHKIRPQDLKRNDIPIGQAINGTQVFLCGSDGHPLTQQSSLSGEIYTIGDGVALGYLGDPQRSAQSFVTLHWKGKSYRAYRTGDLARYDNEGNLRFIGRVDNQVKLNGYRLNLNGIEAKLRNVSGVSDCALFILEHQGNKRLIAALQADNECHARQAALGFPSWERPSAWFCINPFPLNRHGKVDRRSLQSLWIEQQAQQSSVLMNEQETACAEWWSLLLGCPVTSPEQHFFESGGNSLHAIQLLATCQNHHPSNPITLHDIYRHATVSEFAGLLQQRGIDAMQIRCPIPDTVLIL